MKTVTDKTSAAQMREKECEEVFSIAVGQSIGDSWMI
jgi:hypothetical protein